MAPLLLRTRECAGPTPASSSSSCCPRGPTTDTTAAAVGGGVVAGGGRWPVGGVVVRGRRLARLSAAACCYLRHCGIQVLGHFPHALRHSPAEPSEPTCQCGHALRHCVHTESNRSRGDAPCRHCFWCTPPPWPMWCTGRCSPCSRCPAACASPPAGSRPHASCRPGGS